MHARNSSSDDEDEEDDDSKVRSKPTMSADRIIKALQLMERQVDTVLFGGRQLLTEAAQEDLRQVRSKIAALQEQLEAKEDIDEQLSDVDALCEFSKLQWNFKNLRVELYRASAIRVPHHEYEFKDWNCPQYFSSFPLPPNIRTVSVSIKLPDLGQGEALQQTKLSVGERDTVNQCVAASLSKATKSPVDVNQWCFKGIGMRDYMLGDRPLFDYEAVRYCIRDGLEIKLALVRRPQPEPWPPVQQSLNPQLQQHDAAAAYFAKADQNLALLGRDDFRGLTITPETLLTAQHLPMSEMHVPFRIHFVGLDRVNERTLPCFDGVNRLVVRTFLFNGCQRIPDSARETEPIAVTSDPRWHSNILAEYSKDTILSALPRSTRVAFILFGITIDKEVPLAWVAHQLVDERGHLCQGPTSLRMWPFERPPKKHHGKHRDFDPTFVFRETARDNCSSDPNSVCTLHCKFDSYVLPVVAPLVEKYRDPNPKVIGDEAKSLSKQQQEQLAMLKASDMLYLLTPEDKALLWMTRSSLIKEPHMLPKFLQCVFWGSPDHRFEAYRLLQQWSLPQHPVVALELLDARYSDFVVRDYAVNILRRLSDEDLRFFLLQCVQCVKYEPYHDSPLVRFLLERALRSPLNIGHFLFWSVPLSAVSPLMSHKPLFLTPRQALESRASQSKVLRAIRIDARRVPLVRWPTRLRASKAIPSRSQVAAYR